MSHSHTAIEYWTEFFQMYRSMPELWLVRSKVYRDRRLKNESYGRLLDLMRTSDPHANVHTLKRKINNFRTSYRRELRKVLESDHNYVPSLWYFKELDFLYELETGEMQSGHVVLQEQDEEARVLHHGDEHMSVYQPVAESDETLVYEPQHESGVENGVDLTEVSESDQVQQMVSEDDDMFSEAFHTEEDVLRLEAVAEGERDPEPEPEPEHDQEPEAESTAVHLKSEHKLDDYQANSMGSIKGSPYANPSGSSAHLRHNPNSESLATDKAGRRIRIRRRRSSDDTDYGQAARKRRVEDFPERERARERDRERDRERERDRDRSRESESENECELIGRRMAAHFRHMRPDQRLFAERIISEVLVYGRMNRLSFEARFLPAGK
ncbi:negative elongation factor E isoform X1 [Drosophila biarmipes]|uniref:negative elongation factor E isoform X1 n=1 Tax=Drosophila biarmipes TaxID=125945 RepID=UPI0007E75322|nr:negative elongation factor E isoform X1 [Drosophila biarmipes]